MKDVAVAAGVSDATVSRVLDGSAGVAPTTREAVEAAVRRTGYLRNGAARQLAGSASPLVGLVTRDTRNPYYGVLHAELQEQVAQRGLDLLVASSGDQQEAGHEVDGLQHLLEQRVAGLLVATGVVPVARLAPFAAHVPIVLVGRAPGADTGPLSSVGYDEPAVGRLLAAAVMDHGHRDIAVVTPPARVSTTEHARATAMAGHLAAAGARPVLVAAPAFGSVVDGVAEAVALARSGAVTAVMLGSDRRLIAFLEAAATAGLRVPRDVSATGVDGVVPGLDLMGLTTVRLPVEDVAARAVEVLAQLMGPEPAPPVRELHPGSLVVGRTLGPAPA